MKNPITIMKFHKWLKAQGNRHFLSRGCLVDNCPLAQFLRDNNLGKWAGPLNIRLNEGLVDPKPWQVRFLDTFDTRYNALDWKPEQALEVLREVTHL